MKHIPVCFSAFTISAALLVSPAWAQSPSGASGEKSVVTAQGSAEIKRPADIMRVQVEVVAKGKDTKEALAALKERRAKIEKKLADLGAAKESITFSEAGLTEDKTDRQRQMEMMVRGRLGSGGKSSKPKQAPEVFVASTLKVEFPLKSNSPDDLIVLGKDLQEKIKAADLGGAKEMKKQSPQDEEAAEEAAAQAQMEAMNSGEPARGEPMFFYVSKVSETDQEKLLKEAFEKAKREAARLAKSAGVELGAIHQLSQTVVQGLQADPEMYAYARMGYYAAQRADSSESDSSNEAIGVKPGKTVYRVFVNASFEIKKTDK